MIMWSVVHPQWRGRGVGAQLTERSLTAARQISELRFPGAPTVLQRAAYDRLTDLIEHLEKHGFTPNHYQNMMKRSIMPEDAATAPMAPDGLTLIGFTPELSEQLRLTHNVALVPDHPGSTPATHEFWASLTGSVAFRADLTFALRDEATGTLAGYIISRHFQADTEATGKKDVYLNTIGTRREYRRRGVASTLIAAVMHAAATQGFDTASLEVRSDNRTGALGVYERAGFTLRRRFINYARALT
jgi:ribosomal protein S18 acetylase RimI-like enzyme